MTDIFRLRELLAAAIAEIDAMEGAAVPVAARPVLMGGHLRSVKQVAPDLGMSEKRLRRIAPKIGAEVRIGGRVLIDTTILAAHVEGKIWANSSTDMEAKICEDPSIDEDA